MEKEFLVAARVHRLPLRKRALLNSEADNTAEGPCSVFVDGLVVVVVAGWES